MGLFGRKRGASDDDADDWLTDLDEAVNGDDCADLADALRPASPAQGPEADRVAAAGTGPQGIHVEDLLPPTPEDESGGWYLPDLDDPPDIDPGPIDPFHFDDGMVPAAAGDLASAPGSPDPMVPMTTVAPPPPPPPPADFQPAASAPPGTEVAPSGPPAFDWSAFDFGSPAVAEPPPFARQPVGRDEALAVADDDPAPATGGDASGADGPIGPEAALFLEILGLASGATWDEVKAAHAEFLDDCGEDGPQNDDQADLAEAIRREMNTAYAALRVLAVS